MSQLPDDPGADQPKEQQKSNNETADRPAADPAASRETRSGSRARQSSSTSRSKRTTLGQRYAAWHTRTVQPQVRKLSRYFRRIQRRKTQALPPGRRIMLWIDGQSRTLVRNFRKLSKAGAAGIKIPARVAYPLTFLIGACLAAVLTVAVMKQRRLSSEVVVVVGGTVVRAPDYYHRLELEVGPQVINRMLEEELVLQFARKRGMLPAHSAVLARVKELKQQPLYQNNTAQSHFTEPDLERQASVQLATEALFSQGVSASEADARGYYRTQSDPRNPGARYYTPETAQMFVISTLTETSAQKALQELRQGQSFSAVERRYSQDRSSGEGGKMFPVRRGQTRFASDPSLENAIFKLLPGEVLGPRKFRGAWVLLKAGAIEPAHTTPYEEVRQDCMTQAQLLLAAKRNATRLQADFLEFRKKTSIQIFWPSYFYDISGRQAAGNARYPK